MCFSEFFPVYSKLTPEEKSAISSAAVLKKIPAGTLISSGSADCLGLMLIRSGQLRAFIMSEDGREITVYRLFERDICLFSASCIIRSLQFDISIAAEKDTEAWIIPADIYKSLMNSSAAIANYTNEIMADRFNNVMWLIEQIMWKSFDKRLASFLYEESIIENSNLLRLTHEKIAAHLGTAREVVTRMLKYFQEEGVVRISRGAVEITDPKKLSDMSK